MRSVHKTSGPGRVATAKGCSLLWLRRLCQALCLLLFLVLLALAGRDVLPLPADLFLRMDPSALLAALAARSFPVQLVPACAVILAASLAGRLFCGWVCPMGSSLDLAGALLRRLARMLHLLPAQSDPASLRERRPASVLPGFANVLVLGMLAAAALLGLNLVFWASPVALATRLWGLLLLPAGEAGVTLGLEVSAPLLEALQASELLYLHLDGRLAQTALFVLGFWVCLACLECLRPRFWCRYLCPAGAILGLFARLAPVAMRRDASRCTHCQRCAAVCPQHLAPGCAPSGPAAADSRAVCLTCQACTAVCRQGALRFGRARPVSGETPLHEAPAGRTGRAGVAREGCALSALPSRRAFCGSLALGSVLAGLAPLAGAAGPLPVRAPGSRPEGDFLALCLRCGACVRACPTQALQPVWLGAGPAGLFSPVLVPRSGACAPECLACGTVCPTTAIQPLTQQEKVWARVGTAVISRELCLAWAEDRRCMVCKENCPYGAVSVTAREGRRIPVPEVDEKRCWGCGFCEKHCPKTPSAIVVESRNALRTTAGNYEQLARAAGFELQVTALPGHASRPSPDAGQSDAATPPPGFLEDAAGAQPPPPGFLP